MRVICGCEETHVDILLLEDKVENVGVVGDPFLLGRFGNHDESLQANPLAFPFILKEARQAIYSVQSVTNEHLSGTLSILLREFDNDGVIESFPTDERSPRLEDDLLRFAVLDELGSSHERVQVDLVDGRNVFRGSREEILQVLLAEVAVSHRAAISAERKSIDEDGTHDTPMLFAFPLSLTRQHPSHIFALTSGPPFGSWIKYRST